MGFGRNHQPQFHLEIKYLEAGTAGLKISRNARPHGIGRVVRHSQRGGMQLGHVLRCLLGKRLSIGYQSPRGESNS